MGGEDEHKTRRGIQWKSVGLRKSKWNFVKREITGKMKEREKTVIRK